MAEATPPKRQMVTDAVEGLIQLREAVATHLRYLDGEVVDGLRTGRHTREVVANIAEHQSRNLRAEVERTGSLTRDGRAGRAVTTPPRPPAPSNQGEGKPPITFSTLEVGSTQGVKHLELWPAGASLCGIDLFPVGEPSERPGFSRKGGRSDWDTPCAECIRRARRYRGQYAVNIDGQHAYLFRAALNPDTQEDKG